MAIVGALVFPCVIVGMMSTYEGLLEGVTSLDWVDTLGSPPVANVVVSGGASLTPSTLAAGEVWVNGGFLDFLRGDCNDDGFANIADGVFLLNALFVAAGRIDKH